MLKPIIRSAVVAVTLIAVSSITLSEASAQWFGRWRRCCCYPVMQSTYVHSHATPCCGVSGYTSYGGYQGGYGYSNPGYGSYGNSYQSQGYTNYGQQGGYMQAPGYSDRTDSYRTDGTQDQQRFRPSYDQNRDSSFRTDVDVNASGDVNRNDPNRTGVRTDAEMNAQGTINRDEARSDTRTDAEIRTNTELNQQAPGSKTPKSDQQSDQDLVPEPANPPTPR